jgi:hypothetical protein
MRIEIDDPALIDDLLGNLRDCQCEFDSVRRGSIVASAPADATDPSLARLQLDGFLRGWCSRHPEVHVRVGEPIPVDPPALPPALPRALPRKANALKMTMAQATTCG